jgi:NAD(P)-dependent dehydrogenase (short-subunit alcohol dehydrogenase family)
VGPGWGNGRAIAVRMVQEGAKVMALDRDQDRLEETLSRAHETSPINGGKIESMTCDVTNTVAIEAAVQAMSHRLQRPGIGMLGHQLCFIENQCCAHLAGPLQSVWVQAIRDAR